MSRRVKRVGSCFWWSRLTPECVGMLHRKTKAAILPPMHFSRHISQLHSTFRLLAALLLRVAR